MKEFQNISSVKAKGKDIVVKCMMAPKASRQKWSLLIFPNMLLAKANYMATPVLKVPWHCKGTLKEIIIRNAPEVWINWVGIEEETTKYLDNIQC